MKTRTLIYLYLLALGMLLIVASFQFTPGYMDAEYYFLGGQRLAAGYGFSEPILWNYLDDPDGIPHPSHAYWMPLASILSAAGMLVGGNTLFTSARVIFLSLGAAVAPLTALLAYALVKRQQPAFLAGLLAAIPGFYLPYMATVDTFGLSMVLGAIWMLAIHSVQEKLDHGGEISLWKQAGLMGFVSGLAHLARADGILWFGLALAAFVWLHLRKRKPGDGKRSIAGLLSGLLAATLAYLLVMSPWFVRNVREFGTPFGPAGSRALWFTAYDELYAYPAELITAGRWWSSGFRAILEARISAFGANLLSALAVQAEIFLLPLMVAGLWTLRHKVLTRIGGLAWLVILVIMTLVFPFAGSRGGFFHSGAGSQPFLWAMAAVGFDAFLAWGQRKRGWQLEQAKPTFLSGLLLIASLLTVYVFYNRVLGGNWRSPAWNSSADAYGGVEESLQTLGVAQEEIIMVNNPPGFYLATGRPAIAIPDGDLEIQKYVAQRYAAHYLVLESNHPRALGDIYKDPRDHPGLEFLVEKDGIQIYKIHTSTP